MGVMMKQSTAILSSRILNSKHFNNYFRNCIFESVQVSYSLDHEICMC